MAINLKERSFLSLTNFSQLEIRYLLDLAHFLKTKKRMGISGQSLKGKNFVLLFEKASTRTRCAFEIAVHDEGGNITFLDSENVQIGKKESLVDTAKVLGRFFDAMQYRGYHQQIVVDLEKHSGIPVFNGLTDLDHPTQILADMMTIEEHCSKPLSKCKIVFVGDVSNNMCYAWMYGCAKMGMHFVAYGPQQLIDDIDKNVLDEATSIAHQTGCIIEVTNNEKCLEGADILYCNTWSSIGEEPFIPEKAKILSPYRITDNTIENTKNPNVLFMHCLPSFHDFNTVFAKKWKKQGVDIREVTDEVFNGPHSVVFDEAENRIHTIKAILVATI